MNERIADLLEQAFDRCRKYDDEGKTGLVKTTEAFYVFAELILKECIDVVDSTPLGYRDYRNQIEEGMRSASVDRLKHHFGVEEI